MSSRGDLARGLERRKRRTLVWFLVLRISSASFVVCCSSSRAYLAQQGSRHCCLLAQWCLSAFAEEALARRPVLSMRLSRHETRRRALECYRDSESCVLRESHECCFHRGRGELRQTWLRWMFIGMGGERSRRASKFIILTDSFYLGEGTVDVYSRVGVVRGWSEARAR